MQLGQACTSTQCGYVFQLPPAVVWDLSAMLDVGDIWEDVVVPPRTYLLLAQRSLSSLRTLTLFTSPNSAE
ncbi:hypothetical protein Ddc_13966 [Ditylenchus destructor]|nr:hypothetical protein Ddc_13966 [Ditylenchus destructor]